MKKIMNFEVLTDKELSNVTGGSYKSGYAVGKAAQKAIAATGILKAGHDLLQWLAERGIE